MLGKGNFMNCSDISTFAPLYLTGELEPARAQIFSAHLDNCEVCRLELAQQTAIDQRLRAALRAEDIDISAIERRVREHIHRGQRTSRRWILAAAGVAAIFLLAIVSYRTMFSYPAKPVYAAAARDHRLEIVDRQPRKWSTGRASIERLAARQGLSSSAVAAFAPAGYHLAQGKLCRLEGRVFLHLVYKNEAGDFSLFLRRPDDTIASDIHTDTFAAEHVAGFQHGQLSALIVTEQSGDTVLRLATSAAAAL